ncbi:NACHT domain-containing protein (plasmid) [Streptomyces sp. A144]|uniref:NACHT domain-containing protein n=1 Tax=Streptomyces sp. A144 TaxID=2871487 RepID=UPI001CBE69CE|nr:NACHT domain-containing protein [Streptomyces sp. A144]UAX58509.1 NACHT domain-containing protein [Streptomyces sp. A144]
MAESEGGGHGTGIGGKSVGVHRETLYRRLRTLRTEAEAAYRDQHGARGLQIPLERQVRRTGLPGTSAFEGKVASRWAPQLLDSFSVPRPDSFEQVLAVIAVWEAWRGTRTLEADGQVRQAWLASDSRGDWQQQLESAWQEIVNARGRTAAASGIEAAADAAVARYFERLVQTCGRVNLDVLGSGERAGEQPAIRLRQVFEAPPASWDPPKPELPARLWQELVERGEVPAEELPPGLREEQVKAWQKTRVERPPVSVLEAVASPQGKRLALLGDPGAGKSTLARYLALALAGGLEKVPAELEAFVEAGAVPVVVELRQLADGSRWSGRTVEDFWEEFNATERMGLPRDVLEYLLGSTHRPVLVIFDGLDEIFDPRRRAEVARQVTAFTEVHEHVRVILTSRVVGFTREVFKVADFSQAKLEDLPKRQIETFIRRWYTAAHPDAPGEASRLSERLISAVRGFRSVAELAGNPMLLTILASIGLGATIPRDRREVYGHAVDVLTGRWDRDAKHLPFPRQDHPDVAAALDELDMGLLQELLERLARRLQESAGHDRGSPLISRSDLTNMIADYVVTDMNYPTHVGRIVANAMVDRLHERAFLLHPYGADMYGFVHRTFLEYLAARELSRRYTGREWTPEQLIDMLAERALNPVWHEVILLFIGQISRQAEAEHATFIARLLHLHRRRNSAALTYRQQHERPHFLELAIRVLAEAHRIPRAPTNPEDHPERSLAIQSNAVVDTLTAHLSIYPWAHLDGAVPALMSFPWSWTGRERYRRWHRAQAPSGRGFASGVLAAALCRTPQEASDLALQPWAHRTAASAVEVLGERWPDQEDTYNTLIRLISDSKASTAARDAALRELGKRWSDREDTYDTILDIAHALDSDSGDVALRVLGEQWPDREDTYNTILSTARNPNAKSFVRDAAVRVLGERWPDREDTYNTILETVLDTTRDTDDPPTTAAYLLGWRWPDRETAYNTVLDIARNPEANEYTRDAVLRVLGDRWPDREDAYNTVLDIARNPEANEFVRDTALRVLGERWPDREDTYSVVLNTARSADDSVRATAMFVLGERWTGREDAYNAVLDIAGNTEGSEDVRRAAMQVLGDRWPDREDAYNAVLNNALEAHDDARAAAVYVLGDRWPDREDAYNAVLNNALEAHDDARAAAVYVLGDRWPDREDAYNAVLNNARDAAGSVTRATAVRVLGDQWPDREDAYNAVLNNALEAHDDARAAAVRVLGDQWPDREDAYNAVLNNALEAHDDARAAAVRVLAQRWPDNENSWACAARAAKEVGTDDLLLILAAVWPEREKTREILLEIAKSYPTNIVAHQALSWTVE